MELNLAPNPLHNAQQRLSFDKIATLIGENGSGKSCILHSVFESKLDRKDFAELRIVCFSSGQNENFSERFSRYLKKERSAGRSLNLSCFYFDKSWSKLLIFLATCLHSNGKVRDFLRTHGYVDEQTVTKTQSDDISTRLEMKFKVAKRYAERVQEALAEEAKGDRETLRATPYFRSLTSFIETNVDHAYDFENALRKRGIELSARTVLDASYDTERPDEAFEGDAAPQPHDNPTVSFFTQAADNDYFIDRSKFKLKLKGDLELDQLSDGEYQLLFLYALIDLFDADNTLFLLDEADSHLHYKNIDRLWRILGQLKGRAITTTHLIDSITANDFHAIKVVEQGRICNDDKLKKLIERLKVLSRARTVEYEVCAKISHMALLDDFNDWEIFLKLAERKELDVDRLSSIYPVKESSGFNSISQTIGEPKLQWTQSLSGVDSEFCTSHVFLICDRDELPLADIDGANGVVINNVQQKRRIREIKWPGNKNVKVFLLAWKRREIKNYLLSYTALNHHGVLHEVNGDALAVASHLKPNDPCDNEDIRKLDVKEIVNPFINEDGVGLNSEKLQTYINLIPADEISADIENMYNFIVGKLN
ncbi:AAA family ATPase [Sedimenticola selenatireducens]|uniref:AAA family ATPase n=1 Tax=Sedimenticola selenatireducens TaxID=191960 RepID=UPI002AAAB64C|nr:AAA family ATPase [Sedimenticola selenatireducens]